MLFGTLARMAHAADYPHGNQQGLDELYGILDDGWGTGASTQVFAQSYQDHPVLRPTVGRIERAAGSPSTIRAVLDGLLHTDVRAAAQLISVPTLVIHATDDRMVPIGNGRWLADNIDGAGFVEIPGEHVVFDVDRLGEELEAFLTNGQAVTTPSRVLSTVLFSDIVGSTEQAAALGDRQWRALLDQHDLLVRDEIERLGGRLVKSTGDGVLATFDGPARGVACGRRLHERLGPLGISVRVGLHTGEIEVRGDDIGGIAVHIGARIADLADAGEVLVSRTVTDLVAGSGLLFHDRGDHDLKGVPGTWQLFSVAA